MRRPLVLFALVASFAMWLDFSRLQQLHHADSLVPILTGLVAWTPFYWGQDRYGMLIPLLAIPVRGPEAHLLLQGFLTLMLSTWGLILLVRFLLPRFAAWVPAFALLIILLLSVPPAEEVRFNILWVQPYMVSFALGLSAVSLVRGGGTLRVAFAVILFLAAAWVNVSFAVVVAPLVLWRALFTDSGRLGLERIRFAAASFGLLALSTYASFLLSSAVPLPHTSTDVVPIASWPHAAHALLSAALHYEKVRAWVAIAVGLAALGLLGLTSPSVRRASWPVLVATGGLVATAIVPFVLAASSRWVAENDYSVRYLLPSLVLIEAACCLLATLPALALFPPQQTALRWASVAAVAVTLFVTVGPPSRGTVDQAFESRWGAAARDVLAARATHVTGDYWKVWPTVFYADWLLGVSRRSDWPFGITDRSVATLNGSRAVATPRVAVLGGRSMWLGLLGPRRWSVVERRPSCAVLSAP